MKTEGGFCALCRYGSLEAIKKALKNGADVNCADKWGSTPLVRAVEKGDADVVHELLRCGANLGNRHGLSPLGRALQLWWSGADNGYLIRLLVQNGADVDERQGDGETFLMYAAEEQGPKLIELLLDCGADPSLKDDYGKSALDRALARDGRRKLPQNTIERLQK